jgi:deoxyribonuclease V
MKTNNIHPWKVTVSEAADIQKRLRDSVRYEQPDIERIKFVAGADVSFSKGSDNICAAVVVLKFPELTVVEEKTAVGLATFPYVPGYLTFREGPALISAFEKIQNTPDVIIFDGQGIAHPRGLGIASHIGILLDKPSIGCAKSVLVGKYEMPGVARGSFSPLTKDDKQIGVALRTRTGVSPVFVSVGNRMNIESAMRLVLDCAPRFRLPEPIRKAHLLSNEVRIAQESK